MSTPRYNPIKVLKAVFLMLIMGGIVYVGLVIFMVLVAGIFSLLPFLDDPATVRIVGAVAFHIWSNGLFGYRYEVGEGLAWLLVISYMATVVVVSIWITTAPQDRSRIVRSLLTTFKLT